MTRDQVPYPRRTPNRLIRLIRFARSHGKLRALYRVGRRLAYSRWLRNWVKFCVVEVFTVSVSELKSQQRVHRAFVVRKAEEGDWHDLESFFPDPQRVRDRLRRGDTCVIALAAEQICAAVWLALGPKDYREDWKDLRCIYRFPAGVCWTYDGRGTRLGAWGSLMAQLPRYLRESGIAEVFTQIECDNRISLDSHKSLGYRPAGLICCFGILGLVLRIYKTRGGKWRLLPGRIGKLELSGKARRVRPRCMASSAK